jgi:protocatechuate 3,4-dioxygenase beta subunit
MTRRTIPKLLGAAATIAAVVAALTAVAGTGFAQTNAAQANYAPTNTTAPAISGTPTVGQTLTSSQGSWTSDTTPTFAYQWQRCDSAGNNCAAITGATAQTYTVQTADVGKTIRSTVTAKNNSGSTAATSAQTAAVTTGGVAGGQTGSTVAASSVVLPNRLVVGAVKFSPPRLTSRAPFEGRFRVFDTSGHPVSGALVQVTALPYSWAKNRSGEVRTDTSGWAVVDLRPSRNVPLGKRAAIVMFVRARVEGQPLLAGSSTRRLVQVTVR